MKGRKPKIMAICIILLLIAMPLSIAQAAETTQNEENPETNLVEIGTIAPDGSITTEQILLSTQELTELENTISQIIEQIESAEDMESVRGILESFLGKGIIGTIISSILKLGGGLKNRALVFSHGRCLKLNPLRKTSFKIRKKFALWHYSNDDKLFNARTIFIKPLAFKIKNLRGSQIGFMSGFTGLHVFISRRLPQRSTTMFLGTARNINGIQLSRT